MPYLNCPQCRLTVYATPYALAEECPRCRSRLGKASRLFRSEVPQRLLERLEAPARPGKETGPSPTA